MEGWEVIIVIEGEGMIQAGAARHGDELWDMSADGLGILCSQCGSTLGYLPGDDALP